MRRRGNCKNREAEEEDRLVVGCVNQTETEPEGEKENQRPLNKIILLWAVIIMPIIMILLRARDSLLEIATAVGDEEASKGDLKGLSKGLNRETG